MYVFIVLVKFGILGGRLFGNSCSLGLVYVFKYKCLIVNLVFSNLGFWNLTIIHRLKINLVLDYSKACIL